VNKVIVAERELQRRNYYYREEAYRRDIQRQPKQKVVPSNHKLRYIFRLIAVAFLLFLILYRFSIITEYQYRVERLQSEIQEINMQNERLKVEIANLKSIARIEDIAKNKLNMKEPDSQQIMYLDRD